MRQLTAAQLEQELRVGTVDLSQVEIVLELGESIEESEKAQQEAIASALTGVVKDNDQVSGTEPVAPVSFEDVLKAQAAKALETIPPDTRAATAVETANSEEIEEAGNPQG
jgi:hypothetical protein